MEPSTPRKVSVIGLGYVGLPVALAFGKLHPVVGFDLDTEKLNRLKDGIDATNEVSASDLKTANILFTNKPADLKKADFHIVAVPTPVDEKNLPDLSLTVLAARTVGENLKKNDIVVFESTFYPGVTEDICIPELERSSGLKNAIDFFVAYSPERVNPGDPNHSFTKVKKVVAAQDARTLEIVAATYALVIEPGVYKAQSIKVAEASKVIENSQRDINIAFINEIAIVLNRLGIDTNHALDAASTKWNFANYRPGLVGGHCIGVDPYYLIEKGRQAGVEANVISAGRSRNESMPLYIADRLMSELKENRSQIIKPKILIFGFTFKENCPDVRNTKVFDLLLALKRSNCEIVVVDPIADKTLAKTEYQVEVLSDPEDLKFDAAVFAVAHREFKNFSSEKVSSFLKPTAPVFDVKGLFAPEFFKGTLIKHLRL